MNLFLVFMFIFFIGSCCGWVLELCYRRLVHGKWINPGLLAGPYLPIYGFGLCTLTFLYLELNSYNLSPLIIILLMGASMTLIEFLTGLIFIKGMGIKLWDYSNNWANFKGIICAEFTIIWTGVGALYYYFVAGYVIRALSWFSNNISFSFILGIFLGIIVIDFCYSTKIFVKIRKYAKTHGIIVRYEEFKEHIRETQKEFKQKYSFIFPFKQNNPLIDYLKTYNDKNKRS